MNDRISELKQEYFKVSQAKRLMLLCLALAVFWGIIWSLNIGPSNVTLRTVWDVILDLVQPNDALTNGERVIVLRVRLPRICASILAGILLACSGLLMQGVFQNPLVSPYTMGVSNGASFGASIAIVFASRLAFLNLGDYLTPLFAFIFAAFTMLLVQGISKVSRNSTATLLLAGVAVGHLFSGLVSLMKYVANEDQLPDLVFWQLGSVSNVTWPQIALMAGAAFIGVIFMIRYAWDLNVMATGEESAISLGVNYKKIRTIAFILSTLMTGAAVSFTGIIGFVGMVAPHIARIIVGNDYRYTIPTASVCGALLLLVADSISRVLVSTVSMPIGVVTSLIGVPFFLWLIVRKKQEV
jgi:iron complex transport system permease protein